MRRLFTGERQIAHALGVPGPLLLDAASCAGDCAGVQRCDGGWLLKGLGGTHTSTTCACAVVSRSGVDTFAALTVRERRAAESRL